MSLKFEVESLEGIDESIAGLYEQYGDKFRLKVEGIDPADELKEALRKEREERKAAKERADALEREARERAEEAARKAGDIESVEKHLREHFASEVSVRDEKIKARDAKIQKYLITDTAARIAAQLAAETNDIPLLTEYIERRITVQERDGDFVTAVKGGNGEPTGLSLDEFVNQMTNDASLAKLVKPKSMADGGGASGSRGGGAASDNLTEQALALKRASQTR